MNRDQGDSDDRRERELAAQRQELSPHQFDPSQKYDARHDRMLNHLVDLVNYRFPKKVSAQVQKQGSLFDV